MLLVHRHPMGWFEKTRQWRFPPSPIGSVLQRARNMLVLCLAGDTLKFPHFHTHIFWFVGDFLLNVKKSHASPPIFHMLSKIIWRIRWKSGMKMAWPLTNSPQRFNDQVIDPKFLSSVDTVEKVCEKRAVASNSSNLLHSNSECCQLLHGDFQ